MQCGLFMLPLHPPERSFTEAPAGDLAQLVLAAQLADQHAAEPSWEPRSLQRLMEEVRPCLVHLS